DGVLRCERLTELLRRAGLDGAAVAEHRDVEVERGQLAQTGSALVETLIAKRVAEVRQGGTRIRSEEQAAARPEQRDLPGALAGDMNRLQAARNRQLRPVVNLLVDRAWIDRH